MSKEKSKLNGLAVQASGMGIALILNIIFFLFIGVYIDKKFNTSPIFTFVFFIVGIAAGGYTIYRFSKELQKQLDKND